MEDHNENFIATGRRIYHISEPFKNCDKNFLHPPAQNKGGNSYLLLRKSRYFWSRHVKPFSLTSHIRFLESNRVPHRFSLDEALISSILNYQPHAGDKLIEKLCIRWDVWYGYQSICRGKNPNGHFSRLPTMPPRAVVCPLSQGKKIASNLLPVSVSAPTAYSWKLLKSNYVYLFMFFRVFFLKHVCQIFLMFFSFFLKQNAKFVFVILEVQQLFINNDLFLFNFHAFFIFTFRSLFDEMQIHLKQGRDESFPHLMKVCLRTWMSCL